MVDGHDVLPELLGRTGGAAPRVEPAGRPARRVGVVPSYYLRYFYAHDEVVRELRTEPARAADVTAMRSDLLSCTPTRRSTKKPELLSHRGGAYYSEAAVELCASLLGSPTGGEAVHVVNTRNAGTLPFLPDDAVVEVPAVVDAEGARPCPWRRSTRCTPDWSRPSRPTRTWRSAPRSTADARGCSARCWPTPWSGRPISPTA